MQYRTDFLTSVLKVFPQLTSDYVYIVVIALGFWLRPKNKLFLHLGFLVPFSTILNGVLKNIFQIARPPEAFWLAQPTDGLGFPSGDVQVATVFWGMILLNVRSTPLKLLIAVIIGGVGCSRVYLGVHSMADVLAGFLIAVLTVWAWRFSTVQNRLNRWWNGRSSSLFLLTACLIMGYVVAAKDFQWPSVIIISMGALVGFCLASYSVPYTLKNIETNIKSIGVIVLSLIILVAGAKFSPVIKTSVPLYYMTSIIKYIVIIYSIFQWLPKLQRKLLRGDPR
jgi:hypothetical protein